MAFMLRKEEAFESTVDARRLGAEDAGAVGEISSCPSQDCLVILHHEQSLLSIMAERKRTTD